jgi:hypothetical protein
MPASAAATLVPGSSWTAVSVKLAQHCTSSRVSAGVNSAVPSRCVSVSSCTSSEL